MQRIPRILAAFLTCLAFSHPAWADETLLGSEVEVDVTAKDATEARNRAMAQVEMDALTALLEKLSPGQAEKLVGTVDPGKISLYSRGVEVLSEKIAGNRYRAKLNVSFSADEITKLLGKTGASSDDLPPVGAFLVIPAYVEGNALQLWEETNPWRSIWRSVGVETPSGDVIVPFGDADDMKIANVTNLTSLNYAALEPLAKRYGVSDVVILQGHFTMTPEMTLNVIKRRANRMRNEVQQLTYRADAQETKEALLRRAARDIVENIQRKKDEEISTAKSLRGGERQRLMILATLTTLSSWTHIRTKLSDIPTVDKIDLLAISPQQIDMVVSYRGAPDAFARAIAGQKLRLVQNKDYWVVAKD